VGNINVHRKGLTFQETAEVLVGETTGVAKSTLAAREYWLARNARHWTLKVRDVIVGAASVMSGFSLGYYWGYENDPTGAQDVVEEQLNSPLLWEEIGRRLRDIYVYRIQIDHSGVIQDVSSGGRDLNLRDLYITLAAARLIDCSAGRIRISDKLYRKLKDNSMTLFAHADAPMWIRLLDLAKTFWSETAVLDYVSDSSYYGLNWWKQQSNKTWASIAAESVSSFEAT
jgi:hypothetical protein